jgi:hypothetical protein
MNVREFANRLALQVEPHASAEFADARDIVAPTPYVEPI